MKNTTKFGPTDDLHKIQIERVGDALAKAARSGRKATVYAVVRHRAASGALHVIDLLLPVCDGYGPASLVPLYGVVTDVSYDLDRRGYVVRGSGLDQAEHLLDLVMRDLERYLRSTGDPVVAVETVENWRSHLRVERI